MHRRNNSVNFLGLGIYYTYLDCNRAHILIVARFSYIDADVFYKKATLLMVEVYILDHIGNEELFFFLFCPSIKVFGFL